MITFEEVEEFLDSASADELELLRVRTEKLLWYEKKGIRVPGKGRGEKAPYRGAQELSEDAINMYSELLEALQERTGEKTKVPLSFLRENNKSAFIRYVKVSPQIVEFLNNAAGKINDAEKQYLYKLAFNTLITMLQEGKIPLSVHSLIMNMHNIPTAMNKAFPGYASAGMLPLVLAKNRPNGA